jgi:AcrR family transcriptional regulator
VNTRTRRTQQTRDERRDEIRRTLLRSIEELVRQGHSLADITVERMATHAGMSRANFYVYFQDRADVLRAWFDTVTEELLNTTSAWWAMGPESPRAELRTVLGRAAAAYRPHVTLLSAVHDTGLYDPEMRAQLDAFLERQSDDLAQHIRDGQQKGFIPLRLPARETAVWLARMAERMQRTILANASDDELDRHLDTYVDIVWFTLYA